MSIRLPAVAFTLAALLNVSAPACATDDAFAAGATLVLPSPNVAKLLAQDEKPSRRYRYGVGIKVTDFGISDKAVRNWTRDSRGDWHWRFDVASPSAQTLDFYFSTLKLPAGATLTITGAGEGNLRVIDATQLSAQSFASAYIVGDRATLALFVPRGQRKAAALTLASVTHGYRDRFGAAKAASKSGACNIDVACSAGNSWHDQMASVARYTYTEGQYSYSCTGTLMANTGNSTTPYFLTAHHCVNTQAAANSVVVYWNYQSDNCRLPGSQLSATPLPTSLASHTQSHAFLRATRAGPTEPADPADETATDFTLLELFHPVPAAAMPFFSGWSRSDAEPTSARGIHHSGGEEKRISFDNNTVAIESVESPETRWRVVWDGGTTEPGASGSGLWDQNKRLVGQLEGGEAACGNSRPDFYGRFSRSWTGGGTDSTRLSNWLDPASTGVVNKNGYRLQGFFQNATDVPIRDNTVESLIVVSGRPSRAPTKLRVNVRIMHTDIRELKVDLVAPNGSVFTLHNRTGPAQVFFRRNLYKTYELDASASFANGVWRLRVSDNRVTDAAVFSLIDAFSLQF
jgi:lysyl endopeptidase